VTPYAVGLAAAVLLVPTQTSTAPECVPSRTTLRLELNNPNYRPGSPVRSRIGTGHVLVGVVRSSDGCRPIAGARIEFFQAGPGGYSTRGWAGRATVITRGNGSYRFEGPVPTRYGGPPHVHFRASARGFRPVGAAYVLRPGETRGRLDLVLVPG
jgi:protocatechuate 3,4-dioxygenase beta subunit